MTRRILFALAVPVMLGLSSWSMEDSMVFAADAGSEEGLVIFQRADKSGGKAIRFNIEQDGRPIGQLLAGSTIQVPLAPGTYNFTVRAPTLDGMDYLTLNVEAGKTYRVNGEILWGWPAGRPKFAGVSESGVATQPAQAIPAPSPAAAPVAANSRSALSSEEAGRLGLKNFTGDWNLNIWSLVSDGSKVEGSGTARGSNESDDATQILITHFESAEFPEAIGGGLVTISHLPGRGFSLETDFKYSDEVLRLTGGYQADSNTYVFYLIGGPGGQIATGVERISVRLEVRSLDRNAWEANTFAHVDGQSTLVQSSSFTRR
jgi:hypothetical protein